MAMWTTWGSVRGDCGHVHKTQEAAEKCLSRDRRGCRYVRGYSDRHVRVVASQKALASYDVTKGPGHREGHS